MFFYRRTHRHFSQVAVTVNKLFQVSDREAMDILKRRVASVVFFLMVLKVETKLEMPESKRVRITHIYIYMCVCCFWMLFIYYN